MNLDDIINDLLAEQRSLDEVVTPLDADLWQLDTPSPRWTIADQIGHLTFFDRSAALAIEQPQAFIEHRDDLLGKFGDDLAVDTYTLGEFRELDAPTQLERWRYARNGLADAARSLDDDARVEWYGPSMGAKSFLTARLMEVWAHGQDVVDALTDHGHRAWRPDTDRLRHIAQLGVITRRWSYLVRGLEAPTTEIRIELDAPSGETWSWGQSTADQSIAGPAGDFCRVVTQRRHLDDTKLTVDGSDALDWMHKAQAFAGAPTDGPAPGTHAPTIE